MIRAALYRASDGQLLAYSAQGHADYADEGSDIVCAAVSVLGTACINSLESVCGIMATVHDCREGSLIFSLPAGLTEQQQHDSQILMGSLRQGLSDVSDQFPQNIRLDIRSISTFRPSVFKNGGKST